MQAFLNRLHSTAMAAHEGLDTEQPHQQPTGVPKPLLQAGAQAPSVQLMGTDNCSASQVAQPVGTANCSASQVAPPVDTDIWSANQLAQPVGTDNCSANQLAQPVGTDNRSANQLAQPMDTDNCSANQLAQPVGTDNHSASCVALCAGRHQLQEAASMCTDHLDTIDIMHGDPPTAQSLQTAGGGVCQGGHVYTRTSSQLDSQPHCKLRAAGQLTKEQVEAAVAAGEPPPSGAADARAVAAEGHHSGKNRPAGMAGQQVQLSLEWLRTAPPQVAAAFLMSVEGMPHVAHKLHYCNIHTHCLPKPAQSIAAPSLHIYNGYVFEQVQTRNTLNLHLPRYMSIVYVQTRQ